ncbi:37191_t:CDS:2, partial [Gigaspora margarita]
MKSFNSRTVLNNKLSKISVTSNEECIQRQSSILSYESNNTDKSGSVFEISSHSKSSVSNSTVSDDFEDELVALNNRLKDNIVNSSFETNNESDLFASDIVKYPKTSPTRVASIYNVSGWEPDKVKKAFGIVNLQYSYGNLENIQSIKKCPFLEVPVRKTYHTCLSVKVCEFTHNTPCSYIDPITNIRCNGKPVFREFKQINNSALSVRKFIGYEKYKLGQKNYIYCPDGLNKEDQNKVIDKCFIVLPNSSMTSYCSFLYKTDTQIVKGKIVNKRSCPVKFYHIVPENLTKCPFIIMISVGIYNYSPPLAIKTPQNIMENLPKIINNEYDLDLTACKLLT